MDLFMVEAGPFARQVWNKPMPSRNGEEGEEADNLLEAGYMSDLTIEAHDDDQNEKLPAIRYFVKGKEINMDGHPI